MGVSVGSAFGFVAAFVSLFGVVSAVLLAIDSFTVSDFVSHLPPDLRCSFLAFCWLCSCLACGWLCSCLACCWLCSRLSTVGFPLVLPAVGFALVLPAVGYDLTTTRSAVPEDAAPSRVRLKCLSLCSRAVSTLIN